MADISGSAIVDFARAKANTKVGSGECFDLADQALKSVGAKSAADFGVITADADYVWGSVVPVSGAQPGDILQYRDYSRKRTVTVETTVNFKDGASVTMEDTTESEITRPHHTSVVIATPSAGTVKIAEQNVDRGRGLEKLVKPDTIHFESQDPVSTTESKVALMDVALTTKIKRDYPDFAKKYANQAVKLEIKTTVTITVGGSLTAYRPQAK